VWVLLGVLLVVAGGALWWWFGPLPQSLTPQGAGGRGEGSVAGDELTVWFASLQEDGLVSETRTVSPPTTMHERAKAALRELIAGPKREALRTLPAEVKVREVFIDDQGTAYVDFTEALSRGHPGGPWSEILTIRSIVQTLTDNMPEIKRVQLLLEGHEADTLAGHVDIRGPIAPTWAMQR
jgi:spore germination protein GerM